MTLSESPGDRHSQGEVLSCPPTRPNLERPVWICPGATPAHSFYRALHRNVAAYLDIATLSVHETKGRTCPATRGPTVRNSKQSTRLLTSLSLAPYGPRCWDRAFLEPSLFLKS